MKVYIVGGGPAYEDMFLRHGWQVVRTAEKADVIQFTGGEDVSPHYYGERAHPQSFYGGHRDAKEQEIYDCYVGDKPLLGICRGSQFLNVMNGGTLYQHVDNHALRGTHKCFSELLQRDVDVTSTHHQMMRPAPHGAVEGYAWKLSRRKEHMLDDGSIRVVRNEDDPLDIETVWYEDTRSLCFQPHPEFHGADSTCEYYFALINHCLGM